MSGGTGMGGGGAGMNGDAGMSGNAEMSRNVGMEGGANASGSTDACRGAVRRADGQVHVDAPAMERLVGAIFERAGCDAEEARRIAWRLTGANLRGHDSHGVLRTRRYVEWMEEGKVFPGRRIRVERETEALAVVDGDYGFGQTVGEQTVDLGVEKARRHGVAVTALKNAGHLGRIGDWAERAAEANCASIHMVNVRGSLIVAPFGAIERRGSTSPFCAGVPLPDAPPVIHDFATSVVAEGKAMVALHGGKPLPDDALVDANGNYTSDPRPLYDRTPPGRIPDPHAGSGALAPFGLHKGSGLNFFMEMFGGALTGSGTAAALGDTEKRRFCNGMFSIYMRVDAFHAGRLVRTRSECLRGVLEGRTTVATGGRGPGARREGADDHGRAPRERPAALRRGVGGHPRRGAEGGYERLRGGGGAGLKQRQPALASAADRNRVRNAVQVIGSAGGSTRRPLPTTKRPPFRTEPLQQSRFLEPADERLQTLAPRVGEDLGRQPLLDDPALVDEQQPVADITGEVHLVGDDHHRHALLGELTHHLQHLADQLRVERRRDLVEQHHLGLHGERAGDGDPLLLAAGEPSTGIRASCPRAPPCGAAPWRCRSPRTCAFPSR